MVAVSPTMSACLTLPYVLSPAVTYCRELLTKYSGARVVRFLEYADIRVVTPKGDTT